MRSTKTCKFCGTSFVIESVSGRSNRLHCSKECKDKQKQLNRRGHYGQILHKCVVCGEACLSNFSNRRYCSVNCRQKACYSRLRESGINRTTKWRDIWKSQGKCSNCGGYIESGNDTIRCDKCRLKHNKASGDRHQALKALIIKEYGGKCTCCGENKIEFLSIDHIDNTGAEHRRYLRSLGTADIYTFLLKNNFPKDNYQILCFNCNCSKQFYGYCPHNINLPAVIYKEAS